MFLEQGNTPSMGASLDPCMHEQVLWIKCCDGEHAHLQELGSLQRLPFLPFETDKFSWLLAIWVLDMDKKVAPRIAENLPDAFCRLQSGWPGLRCWEGHAIGPIGSDRHL